MSSTKVVQQSPQQSPQQPSQQPPQSPQSPQPQVPAASMSTPGTIAFLKQVKPAELAAGIAYGFYYSRKHIFHSYLVIPAGLISIFAILYALNLFLTRVIRITFPCSVLGMLINLVLLCVFTVGADMKPAAAGSWKQRVSQASAWALRNYLTLIKPSMNFTLKWINVFFIPSFIILPLSDPITFVECLKIAGVFVVGFLLLFCVDVYLIIGFQWVLNTVGVRKHEDDSPKSDSEALDEDEEIYELDENPSHRHSEGVRQGGGVFTTMRDDITTIEIETSSTRKAPPVKEDRAERRLSSENPFEHEEIPPPEQVYLREGQSPSSVPGVFSAAVSGVGTPVSNFTAITASNASIASPNSGITASSSIAGPSSITSNASIAGALSPNTQRITIFITNYIDWIFYSLLFLISLPFYYLPSIHTFLPYHLGLTIVSYYIALLIPQHFPRLKKIAHPILVSTGEILLVLFIGSLIYHRGQPRGFIEDLRYYKTGKNYLNLFSGKVLAESGKLVGGAASLAKDPTGTPQWPGCGDVLSSLMDISIVSLSLPMFTHRKDFLKNFWILMPALLVSTALTYFCYPLFCYHIGIAPTRAIGFIGRSVTLALGTPLITTLGGSVSLMACCTILSGICGVLVGDSLFKLLRVPKDDYVTRGVSLGINCGAIATAHLLNVDPRAASMSSISFSVFGTIMIVLSAIVSVKETINHWVGL